MGLKGAVHIVDQYIPDDEIAGFFGTVNVFAAPYIGGTQSAALKTALGFGLPCVATDILVDPFLRALPDRCRIVPTGNAAAFARGIAKQLSRSIQDSEQIEVLVNRSWQDMLMACTQAPANMSLETHDERAA